MGAIVESRPSASPRALPEKADRMASADLRKSETRDFLADIGSCLNVARHSVGWNLDELANALGRDPRQVRRWIAGEERTQLDAIWAVPALRAPFVVALAQLAEGCQVETVVRIRRTA